METEPWISNRKANELEAKERIAYFDKFIDMALEGTLEIPEAIQAYKETLEYQGIPLSPKVG